MRDRQDKLAKEIQRAHDEAEARGEHTYIDPQTGFQVFTRTGLLAKGSCCGSGCRHCPYEVVCPSFYV